MSILTSLLAFTCPYDDEEEGRFQVAPDSQSLAKIRRSIEPGRETDRQRGKREGSLEKILPMNRTYLLDSPKSFWWSQLVAT